MMRAEVVALSREAAVRRRESDDRSLFVDTANIAPTEAARFATMNPFHVHPTPVIPVPGCARMACSVEAVWQGLKIVDGQTDLAMLVAQPAPRPPLEIRRGSYDYAASIFQYGDLVVDLVTARYLLYLPSYLHALEHLVPGDIVSELVGTRRSGLDVVFFDADDNFDIDDPNTSFSHSALLAAYFGGRLDPLLERLRTRARHHGLEPRMPEVVRYRGLFPQASGRSA